MTSLERGALSPNVVRPCVSFDGRAKFVRSTGMASQRSAIPRWLFPIRFPAMIGRISDTDHDGSVTCTASPTHHVPRCGLCPNLFRLTLGGIMPDQTGARTIRPRR